VEAAIESALAAWTVGDAEGALAATGEALELDPDSLEALEVRAAAARLLGRWEVLAETLSRLAEQSFDQDETLAYLVERGEVLAERLGDPRGAEEAWRQCLEWEPMEDRALEPLAALYRAEERWTDLASLWADRAKAARDAAAVADEAEARFLRRAAAAAWMEETRVRLGELEDTAGALAASEAALEMAGEEDPEALETRVRALAAANERQACRAAIDRLLPMLLDGPLKDEMLLLRGR